MDLFKSFTMGFLNSSEDSRAEDIILKRHSLNGQRKHTLRELGEYHNITRERIRQIETEHIDKLKELMMEHEQISKKAKDVLKLVEFERVIPEGNVCEISTIEGDLKEWELFYLDIIGLTYYGEYNLLHTSNIKKSHLKDIIRKIRMVLKDHVIPMESSELFKGIDTKNLTNNELAALAQIAGASSTGINGKLHYQLPIDKNWSAGSLAQIILWENGKPLTTKELLEQMNIKYGADKEAFNTVNQMGIMDAIVNIDLHTWALKDWNLESNYVLHIMEGILEKSDKPMTKMEIVNKIRQKRSDVRPQSVDAYSHLDTFARLGNGLITMAGREIDLSTQKQRRV